MAYNEKIKETNAKYMKDSQVRVPLNWLKSDFEGRVKPAILSTGIAVSTYIKDAVNEKMIREGLCRPEDIPSEIPGTVRAAIQKYINNDKKTVLYITIGNTMYTYVKADKAGHTWEAAIDEYGDMKCSSVSDEDYVVEIRCKGEQNK